MKIKGYYGVFLDINLTAGKIEKIPVSENLIVNYLGGRGFGAKILYDNLKPGTDPYGEDNLLMFMTGPLSGFPVPSASRLTVITKSPHTSPVKKKYPHSSTLSYSSVGGFFAPEIKFAGYDGIIIRGKSPYPVYLYIKNDKVEIRDARKFWGMGTNEFDKKIKEEFDDKKFQVIYIGPSGENLVEYSSVLHTASRAAGRGGVGAVMGSKKLKAIAVRGTKMPPVSNHKDFVELLEKHRKIFKSSGQTLNWRLNGTAGALVSSSRRGSQAVKNYREGTFKEIDKIGAEAARKKYWVKNYACYTCMLACKKSGVITDGPYAGISHDGPEYETGTMLGANLLVSDLAGLLKEIFDADDYGVDAISIGNTIGFLMEAYEKGLIDIKFLDGIDLIWGNVDAILKMMKKIVHRDGVGELASHGVKFLSEKIGKGSSEFAIHVKGHELAAWNVHVSPRTGISYATSNRGACHLNGGSKRSQDRGALLDSLGICRFAFFGYRNDGIRNFINAITGIGYTEADFLKVGERIFNTEKMFNVREGFDIKDDVLPERFFKEPLSYGAGKGKVLTKEGFYRKLLHNYYIERGWDPKTSIPTKSKLKELEIS